MITAQQQQALLIAFTAAKAASHIQPGMAAVEAMVESAWGTSKLVVEARNWFGCKQHSHPIFGTINLPTREFLSQIWQVVDGSFVAYPSDAASFEDRMHTLTVLRLRYPHYDAAFRAATPELYVTEVSRSWSTDPYRANTCIDIYHSHLDLLT